MNKRSFKEIFPNLQILPRPEQRRTASKRSRSERNAPKSHRNILQELELNSRAPAWGNANLLPGKNTSSVELAGPTKVSPQYAAAVAAALLCDRHAPWDRPLVNRPPTRRLQINPPPQRTSTSKHSLQAHFLTSVLSIRILKMGKRKRRLDG